MFCHKCGAQLADGAGFCHKCGTKVVYNGTELSNEDESLTDDGIKSQSPQQIIAAIPGQKSDREHIEVNERNIFKEFVNNHIQKTTKFQSVDDLIMNSRPLAFIWLCIGIPLAIGFILGAKDLGELTGWITSLLVFGVFFGYITVYITSGVIRGKYRRKFSGSFEQNIDIEEFRLFLTGHLPYLSPYFHQCGYLSQSGLLAAIDNKVSKLYKETILCCEYGPKKKSLALLCIRPDPVSPDSGRMQYFVNASRNGFILDRRAAGFLGHACLIKTAPIMQAAIEYYLKNYTRRNEDVLS